LKGSIEKIITPIRLEYTLVPGAARARFLRGIEAGRLIAQRCPVCGRVSIPMNGSCTTCAVPLEGEVELTGAGTVTTFCVVNIPFEGRAVEIPYVAAWILLDGTDLPFLHIIQGMPARAVRMGLRVRAVWVPPEERQPTLESIACFEPSGEPDAPYESFRDHL
jgi:hypothetical protein